VGGLGRIIIHRPTWSTLADAKWCARG
jgi:hypothetical protein